MIIIPENKHISPKTFIIHYDIPAFFIIENIFIYGVNGVLLFHYTQICKNRIIDKFNKNITNLICSYNSLNIL